MLPSEQRLNTVARLNCLCGPGILLNTFFPSPAKAGGVCMLGTGEVASGGVLAVLFLLFVLEVYLR